jgi:hypothetical protein
MMSARSDKHSSKSKDAAGKDSPRELPLAPLAGAPKTDRPEPPGVDADPLQRWREARELEDEMNEMFDEDRVTHKHGNAEPESD